MSGFSSPRTNKPMTLGEMKEFIDEALEWGDSAADDFIVFGDYPYQTITRMHWSGLRFGDQGQPCYIDVREMTKEEITERYG